ncbi:asparaginase [Methylobacterium sp. 13MFTsu3.1M2]|uniref:asparaginase n=1 Tax=Methylobacterium sp. 13MFTsu3.1M2 TaxID=1502776 RepID=UPI0008EB7E26|nr:asparaginase [Methylobacterium sp. 13MFTsu3.1M2]SFD82529.1 L-asparaginase [Methylobacterium sp. 13MFTsu3.1M2]
MLVLATGGTIAQTTGKDSVLTGSALVAAVPGLDASADVSAEQVAQVSSPDVTSEIWLRLARRVNESLSSGAADGVVVTHGTDTMGETAYFLDLVVKSDKPVVVVGSMRGSGAVSADGPANLANAVAIAADPAAKGAGVLVTLNDQIFAARHVTETNATALDAFKSPDFGALGVMQGRKPHSYRTATRRHTTATEFDISDVKELPRVSIVYPYVDVGPGALNAAVVDEVKGVVYAGTGNGSIPKSVQPAVTAAIGKGVIVVRSSRVNGGLVERDGEHDDDALGTVTSDSLNPQKGQVLLMLALRKTQDAATVQRMFSAY